MSTTHPNYSKGPVVKTICIPFLVVLATLASENPTRAVLAAEPASPRAERLSDDELLTLAQRRTFNYFWGGAEATSLAARERFHLDEPMHDAHLVTSGGTGFGLMALLVGIERGFVTREQGVERLGLILDFLQRSDRFHGVWPHWLDGQTGKVKPFGQKDDGGDLVETSFLAQGLLCVRQYFRTGNDAERRLAAKADELWRQIEWSWHRGPNRENVLFWHWSPRYGWEINFRIRGYNECLITYVLAASSPTHAISAAVYHDGWAEGGRIRGEINQHSIRLGLRHQGTREYCGPLFWAHYSFLGLDPRGLQDRYADYWEHNRNHVRMVRAYCIANPRQKVGYGKNCWGLTSSYSLTGYSAHSPDNDEGTITPTAALASFPYEPAQCMEVLRFFYEELGDQLFGEYGFYDAFNAEHKWFPRRYLAIDQGPAVVMMENHRTGLLWNLFMSSPEIQAGLNKLGFKYRKSN
jgi:hypothetical protein